MKRLIPVSLLVALAVFWFWNRGADLPPASEERTTPLSREVSAAPSPLATDRRRREADRDEPILELKDSPERLQYRADMGAVVASVGLGVVECAFRDPMTGEEVGRYITFVNGAGNGVEGDSERSERTMHTDRDGRWWTISWDMPDEATHATCHAELAATFTLDIRRGETDAYRLFCDGSRTVGVHEVPIEQTPCTLMADGVEPVEIAKAEQGDVRVVTLRRAKERAQPDEPSDAQPLEDEIEQALDEEATAVEDGDKWILLVQGLDELLQRTPPGHVHDILAQDVHDYSQSAEHWKEYQDDKSEKVDDLAEQLDEELAD